MPDKFTEDEMIEIFNRNLKDDVSVWRKYAQEMYEICQGHPFTMTLIGSLLKDFPDR